VAGDVTRRVCEDKPSGMVKERQYFITHIRAHTALIIAHCTVLH